MSSQANSAEQGQSARPRLHIRSARELFGALESSDGATRLAALQAVRKAPETALSFGLHAHRDVIDVLILQAEQFRGEWERFHWIGALAAFHDSRVVRLFTFLITTEWHAELLFALANYLRAEPLERMRYQLGAALMQNECAARARAVAGILAACPSLSVAEALRIGLLEGSEKDPLPMFSAAVGEWLSELAGPFQSEARNELRRQGASTLTALVDHWDRLSKSTKGWLLEWAAEINAGLVLDPIREVLTTRSEGLIRAALETAANLKEVPADLGVWIAPFLHHTDEVVRRAVVWCCSDLDFGAFFEAESSILVKQACLAKLAKTRGPAAIPALLGHLCSADWRIRAAAAAALLLLGPAAVRAAIELVPVAEEPVLTAVARMVASCSDEDLLEAYLRACEASAPHK